ncbi:MAG: GIY-YIG nuclease family protein [Candidatus Marinimicrobia bacterium]|jgi:predicted GIY-YIG superfamily endonuclease|nr:GIY-YIG nuclease family protein [Candidatus Neomarinimicrobiota bacterium]MBT3618320.1 GIY-YIG nuclease family protein [Candidatus Neomarinimicrobiota bacterium]MBT3828265.1 GIY-YIG nuclease family protein [Candidatus Neomarinimicrobiota bacterium]MBT3997182.1 GIY-YIG nuclease family protein [Candidatus Neomarinimicrobiota bacterium]MBT4280648.1 GIY-YIG nuclease family protein [Candidatus Neomarinimicrobiota bacterium]
MKRYYVYVIELDRLVADLKKFRNKNPKYIKGNNCVYVGQSTRKPEIRFEQHKEGYKSNTFAKRFGLKLRKDLYEKYNPIPTRKDAEEIETMLGKALRAGGMGVWFN